MRVLAIGASTPFAEALVPALCADERIEAVTGIGAPRKSAGHRKLRCVEYALDDSSMGRLLGEHEALVHLASVALPRRMSSSQMFDVNVRSTHKLFHAARDAGMRRLVYMSSATVYGAAVHADEQAPLKPCPGFLYAQHQAQLERQLAIELPECVRLRPQPIVGPRAPPALKWVLRQPFYPKLPEPQPLIQCVHEDDVARAVLSCLHSDVRGPYNLAIEDSFSFRDAIQARHVLRAAVSPAAVKAAIRTVGRLQRWTTDPGVLEPLFHTLIVNCRRAAVDLGWRNSYTAMEAIKSM